MESTRRRQQSEQTYSRFIETITGIIAKGEVQHMTIRSLCGSLGLSPRTFYLYFDNKEHAILKCYGYYMDELMDEVEKRNRDSDSSLDRVMRVFDAKARVSLEAIRLGRQLYICALNYYDDFLFSDELAMYKTVKKALDDSESQGICRYNTDTRTIAWELIDFSRGIVMDYLLRNESYDLLEISAQRMQRYYSTFIDA